MTIQRNVSLKPHNSFGFDVPAEYFAQADTQEAVLEALSFANHKNLPVMALGGGSNLVLSKPVQGLVLAIGTRGIHVVRDGPSSVDIDVEAGEQWHDLVMHCTTAQWHGLENLALIPGRTGAAPIQNIGAYGVELCDVFQSLTAIDTRTLEAHTFDRDACRFAYRDSVFKREARNRFLITRVCLRLEKTFTPRLGYAALARELETRNIASPGASDVVDAVCRIRRSKLPDPATIGNAGSFFTNPTIDRETHTRLQAQFPDLVSYPLTDGRFKLAAAWLIDHCGWRGRRRGNVGVHSEQALVLVNHGAGSGPELLALACDIRQSVQTTFGVGLDIEPLVL